MKTKHEQLEKSPRKYFSKKFPVFNYHQMSIINVAIEISGQIQNRIFFPVKRD